MKAKPYPKYKPSGVEWLGDVPEHWEVKRSDAIVSADRRQLAPEAFADCEVFHYSIPVVQETGTGQVENGESIASAKQLVKKPVVLVSKLNPRKATICVAKPQAILTLCSTEFVALNADECELAFLEYLTRAELFRQGLDSKVESVTRSHQRANPADIYKFWNAWPTVEEQRTIAVFLDRETGRIDALVAKKRELIERLKEKRAALISRTVTRGLPPAAAQAAGLSVNPPVKDSGLEWLGEIPGHWEVKKLSWLFRYAKGPSAAMLTKEYISENPGGYPVFSGQTENNGLMGMIDWHEFDFDKAAIFVTTVGARAMSTRMVVGKFSLSQNCALIFPRTGTTSAHYFEAVLRVIFEYERGSISQIMQPSLRFEDLDRFRVPLPPPNEQFAIAAYLDAETAKLDSLVAKVEQAVERLQEYRSALITAAVTGKIDVRKEVTRV